MSLHKEISFETEVCEHLAVQDWLYAEGDAAKYDRALAFFPADVLAWVQQAQPKAWEALTKNHGAYAGEVLLARLREQLNTRGTLDVLRHGVEMIGLRQKLPLAQFKPALAMNPEILDRYEANRLRIVRQVRYSLHNENCIDLVLFLNGLPVATVELKTDFTQSVEDAVDQYRFDRLTWNTVLVTAGKRLCLEASWPPKLPWLVGFQRAGALGHEHAESPATGVCGLRSGIVDTDVAFELGMKASPSIASISALPNAICDSIGDKKSLTRIRFKT